MKAISLKPAGTAQNFRIFAVLSQFYHRTLGHFKDIYYLCSAPISDRLLSRTSAVNARNTIGLFLCLISPIYTAAFRNSMCSQEILSGIGANGKQPFLLNAPILDSMKAISLKPAGTAQNFRIFAVFSQFLINFGLHIAAISTIVCYVATIFGADIIASLAAFAAILGIYPQTKFEKGEEKI